MEIKKTFYDKVCALCVKHKITIFELLSQVGMPRRMVISWKDGVLPPRAVAVNIANYFGVSVSSLCNPYVEVAADLDGENPNPYIFKLAVEMQERSGIKAMPERDPSLPVIMGEYQKGLMGEDELCKLEIRKREQESREAEWTEDLRYRYDLLLKVWDNFKFYHYSENRDLIERNHKKVAKDIDLAVENLKNNYKEIRKNN